MHNKLLFDADIRVLKITSEITLVEQKGYEFIYLYIQAYYSPTNAIAWVSLIMHIEMHNYVHILCFGANIYMHIY